MPGLQSVAAFDRFSVRMAAFYGAFFLTGGIVWPFLPAWLQARGLDAWQIGFVLAIPMVVRPLVVPVATRLADRFGVLKAPLVIAAAASVGGLIAVALSHGFVAIAFAYALASLLQSPMLPLADAYALRGLNERGRAYGPVRLWGSVTFIAANLAGGVLLSTIGASNIVWAVVVTSTFTALCAGALSPVSSGHAAAGNNEKPGPLWRSPAFVAVLAAASLIQSSHAVLIGFATLQWTARGLQGPAIGFLWGIGVVAEIALFAVSGRVIAAIGALGMIGLGSLGAVVRWSVMAFDPPSAALPALQCLHALSFGATHLGSMHILARLGGQRLGATAQGDFSTVVNLVSAAAMGLSGGLVASLGAFAYLAMAAPAAAGGLIVMLTIRRWRAGT